MEGARRRVSRDRGGAGVRVSGIELEAMEPGAGLEGAGVGAWLQGQEGLESGVGLPGIRAGLGLQGQRQGWRGPGQSQEQGWD